MWIVSTYIYVLEMNLRDSFTNSFEMIKVNPLYINQANLFNENMFCKAQLLVRRVALFYIFANPFDVWFIRRRLNSYV